MPLILLLVLFVAEVAALVAVGTWIGVGWTVLLFVGTSVLGGVLLRNQGRRTLTELRQAQAAHRSGCKELADGALGGIGALFMVLPGFLTDLVGLLLVLPPTRALVRPLLGAGDWLERVSWSSNGSRGSFPIAERCLRWFQEIEEGRFALKAAHADDPSRRLELVEDLRAAVESAKRRAGGLVSSVDPALDGRDTHRASADLHGGGGRQCAPGGRQGHRHPARRLAAPAARGGDPEGNARAAAQGHRQRRAGAQAVPAPVHLDGERPAVWARERQHRVALELAVRAARPDREDLLEAASGRDRVGVHDAERGAGAGRAAQRRRGLQGRPG